MILTELVEPVIEIAKQAGKAIAAIADSNIDMGVHKKADKTPVTIADLTANRIITQALAKLTPDIPIISEEGDAGSLDNRLSWKRCWLVDPLDGTRGFIDGSGQYTVNIALIDAHRSVMGVIYAPAIGEKLYYAVEGEGAFSVLEGVKRRLHFRSFGMDRTLNIAVSQYHHAKWLHDLIADIPKYELVRMNSSVKICFVAEGVVDIYPRLGPTSEWDTAAGQCIVEQAGAVIVNLEGQALTYNARPTLKNPGFIVIGDQKRKAYFLDLIQRVRREK